MTDPGRPAPGRVAALLALAAFAFAPVAHAQPEPSEPPSGAEDVTGDVTTDASGDIADEAAEA
ncbi:MAG: hypothetical protein AAFU79_32285, partial [Myxococcota bacterium]